MKLTIRKKINFLVLGCISLFTVLLAVINYNISKNSLLESVDSKLISDIQLSYEYLDAKIPGEWHLVDGELHKGNVSMVENYEVVDTVGKLTGGNAVSIFQGNTRISTNIIENGQRQINTEISEVVADVVLNKKERYTGIANVLGVEHQSAYQPIFDKDGSVIGIWSTAVPTAPYLEIANNARNQNIFISIAIAVVIILAISLFTQFQVINPIKALSANAAELSNLNLKVEIYKAKGNDEISNLAKAFNEMKNRLKATMTNVSNNANRVANSSNLLAESSKQTSEAANQIALTMNELAAGTVLQSEQSEKIVSMMRQTIAEVSESLERANETLQNAITSTNIARKGEEAINEAIVHLAAVTKTVSYATDSIQKLGKRSEEIGGIITVISDIAEQTNLLALNAAIEAARAGEHGKGFAVVASEVRKLSEQSQQASGRITNLIKDIQAETSVTVRTMESNLLAVEEQVMIINKGGEALKEIVEKVVETETGVKLMKNAFEKVNSNSLGVQQAIQEISSIIEESAASTEEVAATSEEQYATVAEITSNSEELAHIADSLRNEVNKFQF